MNDKKLLKLYMELTEGLTKHLENLIDAIVKSFCVNAFVIPAPVNKTSKDKKGAADYESEIAKIRKQAEEEWERQIKESVNSTFKSKGADAAFVGDKFENYSVDQETVQDSTQKSAVLEVYQPFVVESGTVVDDVMIDATDDPELDVNEQENHRECTDPSELDSYKQKWQCECNEALDEYLKADEALKQEKPLLPIIIRGDQIPD